MLSVMLEVLGEVLSVSFEGFSSFVFDLERNFGVTHTNKPTIASTMTPPSTKVDMTQGSVGNPHRLRLVGIKK